MAKTRLIAITDPAEVAAIRAGGLECPALFEPPVGQVDQTVYADADEYRAWKASKSGTAPSVEGAGSAEAGRQ